MYTNAILWILSWPVLIIISYQVIKLAVKRLGDKIEPDEVSKK